MSSLQPTVGLDLKPTFGWVFIGAMFGGVFYGITVVQTVFYFQTYPNDRSSLKAFVVGIWLLDTLSLILISYGTYTWLVIDFANPSALGNIIWTVAAEPICSASIALCVHLFMACRIYMLSRKLVLPAIMIALFSFAPFGVGIAAATIALITPGGFAGTNQKLHSAAIVANVSSASLDIIIATLLVVLLRMHAGDQVYMKRSNKMISRLTTYLVSNNLLTSVIVVSGLIAFFASPNTLAYQAINITISKAYTNTFLSQLNARQSIRGRGIISNDPTTATKNMDPIAFNLGPMSEGNEEELDFQAADPTMSSSSIDIVQSHVNSEKSKHTHEMSMRDSETVEGPYSNAS